jgi:hypothetical protein
MWFKFAAIAAFVFHRADAFVVANTALQRERHRAVDFWTKGIHQGPHALRGTPIHKNWQTETGQTGNILLGEQGASVAAAGTPKSLAPGPPEDYNSLRHKAAGLKHDHPINRNYK